VQTVDYRKGHAKEAKLAYLGHVLLDTRHGLVANVCATAATATADRDAALDLRQTASHAKTVAGAKNHDVATFVAKGFVAMIVAQSPKSRARSPYSFNALL
jgi:hypothetical protein